MDINHNLLNAMGVGHPALNKIYNMAKEHSCSCKLTGAGGGGCALILLPYGLTQDSAKSSLVAILR